MKLEFASHKNPVDVETASTAVIAISVGCAFLVIVIAAVACYLHRRRSTKEQHTTLLLKKAYSGERPISLRRPTAVKSPGSSGVVGPTLKKSPSPTGQKSPPGNNEQSLERRSSAETTTRLGDTKESRVICELKEKKDRLEERSKPQSDDDCDNDKEKRFKNEIASLGKLYFKLKYNYEKHALCVTVVKCEDLPPPRDANVSNSDPYVKLQLLPDKQHKVKTRVLRKTLTPVYDEDFTFYGITPNQLETTTLHFVVLSFDRYSRDDIIGEVIYQLGHQQFDTLEKQISLIQDISPRSLKLRSQGRGEILVSLCYQPAANRLTVVVLKARNLPKMDVTGLCDPYVKIYLMYNNQRIAKKKTHVKKRTTNPVFNESFVFDVPYNDGLDNLSLEFVLLDYDRVTKNEVIGKLEIGSKATGTALKHWKDVASSPRRQIAEWHKL